MCDDIEQELKLNFMAMEALENKSMDEKVLCQNQTGVKVVNVCQNQTGVKVNAKSTKKKQKPLRRHNKRSEPLAEMQLCKLKRGSRR